MSVQSYLTSLASNLVLSEKEKESIQVSISTLEGRVNSYFGNAVLDKFKFGSYTRFTILPRKVDPRSDIDYMLVFENKDRKKPQSFLNRLRKFVEQKYSTSEIAQSYPTIVLELNHIKFELVPAYRDLLSRYFGGYYIPTKDYFGDNWMTTNPKGLNDSLTEKNRDNKFLIKPLVRLIKYWNAQNGYVYSSFELEKKIIEQIFIFKNIKDMLFQVINSLSTYNLSQLNAQKVYRLKSIVKEVKRLEYNNLLYTAVDEIKKAFPEY